MSVAHRPPKRLNKVVRIAMTCDSDPLSERSTPMARLHLGRRGMSASSFSDAGLIGVVKGKTERVAKCGKSALGGVCLAPLSASSCACPMSMPRPRSSLRGSGGAVVTDCRSGFLAAPNFAKLSPQLLTPHANKISYEKNPMIPKSPFPLDPLDRELLERALESVHTKVVCAGPEFESHAELEAMLRAELIEIARTNGVDDGEVLRRMLPNEPSAWTGTRG
jgi:hypothetical protein